MNRIRIRIIDVARIILDEDYTEDEDYDEDEDIGDVDDKDYDDGSPSQEEQVLLAFVWLPSPDQRIGDTCFDLNVVTILNMTFASKAVYRSIISFVSGIWGKRYALCNFTDMVTVMMKMTFVITMMMMMMMMVMMLNA